MERSNTKITNEYYLEVAKGKFIGPCDIGFMGKVSVATAECSVEFELLLIDNNYL